MPSKTMPTAKTQSVKLDKNLKKKILQNLSILSIKEVQIWAIEGLKLNIEVSTKKPLYTTMTFYR